MKYQTFAAFILAVAIPTMAQVAPPPEAQGLSPEARVALEDAVRTIIQRDFPHVEAADLERRAKGKGGRRPPQGPGKTETLNNGLETLNNGINLWNTVQPQKRDVDDSGANLERRAKGKGGRGPARGPAQGPGKTERLNNGLETLNNGINLWNIVQPQKRDDDDSSASLERRAKGKGGRRPPQGPGKTETLNNGLETLNNGINFWNTVKPQKRDVEEAQQQQEEKRDEEAISRMRVARGMQV